MEKVNHFSIFHFNDVYEIEASTVEPVGGAARFVTVCKQFKKEKGEKGLVLFSGDLFSPSTLSVLYKGEQMIEPINACNIDVACVGNHEFDFNLETIQNRFKKCNFPWLCSNIFNIRTNGILADNHAYYIEERAGVRIGIMGMAENDWLNTITEIDMSIVRYEDFVKCAKQLIEVLKKEHDCEMIIALTHMRVPNDKLLAKEVPEIDLILGGHDHIVIDELVNESLFIKSGTDFKDYSILDIEVGDFSSVPQAQREQLMKEKVYIIKNKYKINLKFHNVTKDIEEDEQIKKHVDFYIAKSRDEMQKVIGYSFEPLDTRFSILRTEETNFGNFYADVIRKEVQADVTIVNSGTIRSDCIFPEGEINYALLNKALPFPDIIVVQELTGAHILQALENGVSKWPNFDGRFPLISGIRFAFDGRKPPGERVLKDEVYIGENPIDLNKKYSAATKQFVSLGKDGYDMFQGRPYILAFENGLPHLQIMISFFKSLETKDNLKFNTNLASKFSEIQKVAFDMEDQEELPPVMQPQVIRRRSSIISQNTPSLNNIKVMRSLKRKQSRIEKVDNSGLVSGIKVHDDQAYIVIAPKCDGRIRIIK
ncbi:hypothetical protein ABPG72_018142 [Tetrahymena utriculariae]